MGQAFYKNEVNMDELVKEEISLLRNLNFAESYIRDCFENYNKWNKVGLLKGISDPFIARQLAELLENQRLWNEKEDSSNQTWRRCSIASVRRAFGEDFLGYKLVSVQTARNPQDYIYWTNSDSRIRSALSPVRTRFITSVSWDQPKVVEGKFFEYRGESYSTGLDAESEATYNFAKEYSHEVSREIVADLLSVCANKDCEYKSPEQLASLIEGMSAYVAKESNWVVASPKICEVLKSQLNDGKLGKLNFYEFDIPNDKILLGYKNPKNHYETGYIYSPYLPFTLLENGLLARYNKKLVDSNFYGSITLLNFGDDLLNYEDKSEDNHGV
jgi:hypothetical protein